MIRFSTTRWWFPIFFIFTPILGEDDPILTNIISDGLKPPTRSDFAPIRDWNVMFEDFVMKETTDPHSVKTTLVDT